MSLEVEFDHNGLLSKQDDDEMCVIDTEDSNSHSIIRNEQHFTEDDLKDMEEMDDMDETEDDDEEDEDDDDDDEGRNNNNRTRRRSIHIDNSKNIDYYNLEIIKQKELIQHLEEMRREHVTKILNLERDIENLRQENDSFESEVKALKQHNECLNDASLDWHQKYQETKNLLSCANEEILDLKTELINLQLLYDEDQEIHRQTNNEILNDQSCSENPINRELEQYKTENLQIRKENKKYLDQLKQANDKYRDSNTKYNDLNNIQMDLQNELNIFKNKCCELNDIVQQYFDEIQSLEQHNAHLKQTLSEIQNAKGLYDEDGNAIEITYAPDSKPKSRFRARSYSQVSAVSYNDSVCDSPIVSCLLNGDHNSNFHYALTAKFDLYADGSSDDDKSQQSIDDYKSDKMEKLYDLYEAMNDYLYEMSECVQSIKTIKLLHKKRTSLGLQARSSSFSLSKKRRLSNNEKNENDNNDYDDDKKDEEEQDINNNSVKKPKTNKNNNNNNNEDDEDETDDDDEEIQTETLLKILDNNEEECQLTKLHEIINESKDCIQELSKQQKAMWDEEKTKYEDLDATYKDYQKTAARRIKKLTKDMYLTQYKKYGGYRDICREMIGNVGTHTKALIYHKLTA